MSADLSRVRFDPLRDHSGIGIQQGRLWLDADFNEQVAITDRRLRAQVADLAPTPTIVSRLTPKAFEITFVGGKMHIGAGRMYVDGMLAENHGAKTIFDPVLAEPNREEAIEYGKQPYWWLKSDALPTAGPYLVYLDVWERELNHLTTPDLVESAVGVDTTTRSQIAWQVRLLTDAGGGVTCASTDAKWSELIKPSPMRLTTDTEKVAPVKDPCEIPPGEGYRGSENQLYRVELHSATEFKWSRDNASIAVAVAEVLSAKSLRLESLGRDEVLSIRKDDWVEITDDDRELAHLSGEMRQVTVNTATSTISFETALPTAELNSIGKHLRVRKWDSKLLSISSSSTPVSLERGITVTFSKSGSGKARPGDYWVFAARATAPRPEESLEKLVEAPPRGIHHHYARLAVITPPGTVADHCRPAWPAATGEGCGCEICVTPQEHNDGIFTIFDAIEQLKKAQGGTLTLCPGTFQMNKPLMLHQLKSIKIKGSGSASTLATTGVGIAITQCRDMVFEDFAITSASDAPAFVLDQTNEVCRLQRLWLTQKTGFAVTLTGVQTLLSIKNCLFQGGTGIAARVVASNSKGLLTNGLSIEDNFFQCSERGIDLGIDKGGVIQHTGPTSIRGNGIRGCSDVGIAVTGLVPQDVEDLAGTLEICDNDLNVTGSGIITGGRARISDNAVTSAVHHADKHGILLDALPPDVPDGVAHVLANKVSGFTGVGISVAAPMRSLIVKHNIIRETGSGIVVVAKGTSRSAAIDNNQILDLRPPSAGQAPRVAPQAAGPDTGPQMPAEYTGADSGPAPSPAPGHMPPLPSGGGTASHLTLASLSVGILLVGVETIAIAGNAIDGVAAEEQYAGQVWLSIGIGVVGCHEGKLLGNTLSRIGRPDAISLGVAAISWQHSLSISDNTIRGGDGPNPVSRRGWIAMLLVGGVAYSLGSIRSAPGEGGMWIFSGGAAYLQKEVAGHAEVNGNTVQGGGEVAAVTITTVGGDTVMTMNRCAQPDEGQQPVVRLMATTALVHGNRLRGGDPSMIMHVDVSRASVLGNITTGGIQISGTMVENTGMPWSPLNSIG